MDFFRFRGNLNNIYGCFYKPFTDYALRLPTLCASQRRKGFPHGSDGKESSCNAGGPGSIPELGRSPGEGNGNPLQYTSPSLGSRGRSFSFGPIWCSVYNDAWRWEKYLKTLAMLDNHWPSLLDFGTRCFVVSELFCWHATRIYWTPEVLNDHVSWTPFSEQVFSSQSCGVRSSSSSP